MRSLVRRCSRFALGVLLGVSLGFMSGAFRLERPCDHCAAHADLLNWTQDPSFALVEPGALVSELRWFRGKLLHPVGRVFGGHHSVLVAKFTGGAQVRIEKFGLGNVEYCPNRVQRRHCNLHPDGLYKSAGGSFLKSITWHDLHASMLSDVEHYDVVDANCHHAVQVAWNSAVIEGWQDSSPAPDTGLVQTWEGFLRWFHGTNERTSPGQDLEAPARALATGDIHEVSFDGRNVRRRRRHLTNISQAQRCRGSKLREGNRWWFQDNCPHRESCLYDQSSSSGAPSSVKDSEFSKKCRCRKASTFSILLDKDFTGFKSAGQSDSKFKRWQSCGTDNDISASKHSRSQVSRPFSQSQGSEDISREEQAMAPERTRCDSKAEDASSISAFEMSHSQDGRSKADMARTCNGRLEGATLDNVDFLCQWTCDEGAVSFDTDLTSSFVCHGKPWELSLQAGEFQSVCDEVCSSECHDGCAHKCRYISSAALDAGSATCRNRTSATSSILPPEEVAVSAGEVFSLVGLIFLYVVLLLMHILLSSWCLLLQQEGLQERVRDSAQYYPASSDGLVDPESPTNPSGSPAIVCGKGVDKSAICLAPPSPRSGQESPGPPDSPSISSFCTVERNGSFHSSPAPPTLPPNSLGTNSVDEPDHSEEQLAAFKSLKERFPAADASMVWSALAKHSCHAGRAATDLRRAVERRSSLALSLPPRVGSTGQSGASGDISAGSTGGANNSGVVDSSAAGSGGGRVSVNTHGGNPPNSSESSVCGTVIRSGDTSGAGGGIVGNAVDSDGVNLPKTASESTVRVCGGGRSDDARGTDGSMAASATCGTVGGVVDVNKDTPRKMIFDSPACHIDGGTGVASGSGGGTDTSAACKSSASGDSVDSTAGGRPDDTSGTDCGTSASVAGS